MPMNVVHLYAGCLSGFPNALCRVLLCVDPIPEMSNVEQHLRASFEDRQDWREGVLKTAFNYILLDPRKLPKDFTEVTKREPSPQLKSFKTFLGSVFYVGKGKRSRPYQHLKEATTQKVVLSIIESNLFRGLGLSVITKPISYPSMESSCPCAKK